MESGKIIQSQYLAALQMLKQVVIRCPDSQWNFSEDRNKFWHTAYHALFYTHLYLQDSEKDFKPWPKHKDGYQSPGASLSPDFVYSREDLLEYLELCRKQVEARVLPLEEQAPSGFYWLPFSKLELHVYNIRHLQQHVGELYERLGSREHIDLDWVSDMPGRETKENE